ncbi:MAG: AAA family ATPase, partial [Paludibacteraceae bacterium]|nr:AAA family ATPase [Paludibacteraceae bacterium]
MLSDNKLESDEKNIIKHEEIIGKELFYDTEIDSQIKKLRQLLNREQYRIVHQRMQEKGFRCGFTCLFYGDPGTGKTETVLQLAKRTGRDILQVNISQIKSMWVGESEKNIKQVFDDYRRKVKDSDITPILLFNEADAI